MVNGEASSIIKAAFCCSVMLYRLNNKLSILFSLPVLCSPVLTQGTVGEVSGSRLALLSQALLLHTILIKWKLVYKAALF